MMCEMATSAHNTTLEEDGQTVLRMWKAMGGDEDTLRKGRFGDNDDFGDISKWKGIRVEVNRVTRIDWRSMDVCGTMPAEIGALSALTVLNLSHNKRLSGELPKELGNLTSLTKLWLRKCGFSGPVPSSFSKLTNLDTLFLRGNQLTTNVPASLIENDKEKVQAYLATLT